VAKRPEKVRLLLADEQCLFREAVKTVLEKTGKFVVVAEASDGGEAVSSSWPPGRIRTRSWRL
jgi:DNA-binding NarL/FixJ family response regulator